MSAIAWAVATGATAAYLLVLLVAGPTAAQDVGPVYVVLVLAPVVYLSRCQEKRHRARRPRS